MSEPFIAEIRIFAGNFAPRGWAYCDGQLLPISQNTALFSLIGTTYGGDGRNTTALPNLQGRTPMHPGRGPGLTSRRLGERGGVEAVTLSEAQMPNHNHALRRRRSGWSTSTIPTATSWPICTPRPARGSLSRCRGRRNRRWSSCALSSRRRITITASIMPIRTDV
ncbi:MAG: tail fiber protein [Xanthomonadaceae bacterium]|nr:tail fiber protein [Xanthomonadaceae bacterium]